MRFVVSLLLSCWLLVSLQLPTNKGYVNDLTSSLDEKQTAYLDQQLRTFEAQEGVQIIIIIVPSLEGQTVDAMAQTVASSWEVGHRGRDSGILMLFAKKEGESYIDLGYAMEASINDEMAKTISKETIDPLLKRGKVYNAVERGTAKVFAAFGKSLGTGGAISVGSFWEMTSLIIFLVAIPILYLTARFAASKHMWVSPLLGFILGMTQTLSLAVALACLGGLMVLICYVIRTYMPPRS